MTVKSTTIQITTVAAGNTLQFTGFGFRPSAVFFSWTGRNGTATTFAEHNLSSGEGFALGTGQMGCVSYWEQSGADPYTTGSAIWDTACIVRQVGELGSSGKATISTMLNDGFELSILEQFGAEITVMVKAISGMEFAMIEFTESATTGLVAYSGAGFRPTFAKFFGAGKTAYNAPSADGDFMLGAASGSDADRNGVYALFRDSSLGHSDAASYCRRTECVAFVSTTAVVTRASLSSFNSDGFTLNWLERQGSRKLIAVVATGRWYVFPGNTASNTTPYSFTGMTWSPEGLMVYGFGYGDDVGASDESTQDTVDTLGEGLALSVGYGTGPAERYCTKISGGGGTGTSTPMSLIHAAEIYVQNVASPGSQSDITALMDISSAFASDTITVVMDDADAGAPSFWYGIAIGPEIQESRARLVRYLHNTYSSRAEGRTIIKDVLGRVVRNYEVKPDNWMFSGAPGFPSPRAYTSLLANPSTFYIENSQPTEGRLKIETAREAMIESLFRRLGGG